MIKASGELRNANRNKYNDKQNKFFFTLKVGILAHLRKCPKTGSIVSTDTWNMYQ